MTESARNMGPIELYRRKRVDAKKRRIIAQHLKDDVAAELKSSEKLLIEAAENHVRMLKLYATAVDNLFLIVEEEETLLKSNMTGTFR